MRQRRANLDTFGSERPPKWQLELFSKLANFVAVRDAGESGEKVKAAYRKWRKAKDTAKKRRMTPDEWAILIEAIGGAIPLPVDGKFSIQSFITS